MASFDFLPPDGYNAFERQGDLLRGRRADNAKAYQDWMDWRVKSGLTTTAQDLDQYRMALSNGDAYLMGGLPPQQQSFDISQRMNQRVENLMIQEATQLYNQKNQQAQAAQSVVSQYLDGTDDDIAKAFFGHFHGEPGQKLFEQIRPLLPQMRHKGIQDQMSELAKQDWVLKANSPDEVDRMAPSIPKVLRGPLKQHIADRLEREHDVRLNAALTAVAALDEKEYIDADEGIIDDRVTTFMASHKVDEKYRDVIKRAMKARQLNGLRNRELSEQNTFVKAVLEDKSLYSQLLNDPEATEAETLNIFNAIRGIHFKNRAQFKSMSEVEAIMGPVHAIMAKMKSYQRHDAAVVQATTMAQKIVPQMIEQHDTMVERLAGNIKDDKVKGAMKALHATMYGNQVAWDSFAAAAAKDPQAAIENARAGAWGFVTKSSLNESVRKSYMDSIFNGPTPGTDEDKHFFDYGIKYSEMIKGSTSNVSTRIMNSPDIATAEKTLAKFITDVQQNAASVLKTAERHSRTYREEFGSRDPTALPRFGEAVDNATANAIMQAREALERFKGRAAPHGTTQGGSTQGGSTSTPPLSPAGYTSTLTPQSNRYVDIREWQNQFGNDSARRDAFRHVLTNAFGFRLSEVTEQEARRAFDQVRAMSDVDARMLVFKGTAPYHAAKDAARQLLMARNHPEYQNRYIRALNMAASESGLSPQIIEQQIMRELQQQQPR